MGTVDHPSTACQASVLSLLILLTARSKHHAMARWCLPNRTTALLNEGLPREPDSRCVVGKPLIQSHSDRCISAVLGCAGEFQCGSDCRYSDLAVAAIESWLGAAAVLDNIVLGHFFSVNLRPCAVHQLASSPVTIARLVERGPDQANRGCLKRRLKRCPRATHWKKSCTMLNLRKEPDEAKGDRGRCAFFFVPLARFNDADARRPLRER
jgi:hypothetical protein